MNSVLLLTRLQLAQTIGGLKASMEKRIGGNRRISTAGTVVLALVLVCCTGLLGYRAYEALGSLVDAGGVYNILFLIVSLMTFTFSIPTVLGTFFGDSDVEDLLALPVTPLAVALSKSLSVLSTAYIWVFGFVLGPMAGWGIASGAGPVYWLTYVAVILAGPMLPVGYAGILSILVAKAFKRVRTKDSITTIATIVTLLLSMVVYLGHNALSNSAVGDVVNNMAASMGGILMAFPSYGFAVYAMRTGDLLSVFNFLLVSVAVFAVFVVVARVLYLRIVMSLSSGSGASKAYTGGEGERRSPIVALARAEAFKVIRNSTLMLNYVAYPIVVAPLIFGFSLSHGPIADALGQYASNPIFGALFVGIAFPFLAFIALIDMASNLMASTTVSREGSNWIHMKFIPVPLRDQLFAKALAAFAIDVLIVTALMAFPAYAFISNGFNPLLFVAAYLYLLVMGWGMVCVGVLADCRHPNVDWGDDGDVTNKTIKGYPGLIRSLLWGLLCIVFVVAAAVLFFLVLKVEFLLHNPSILMLGLDVVGGAIAFVAGNAFLKSAARELEDLE